MDDPLLVGGFERFRDSLRDRQRLVKWDGTIRDAVRERGTFDEFEDERNRSRLPVPPLPSFLGVYATSTSARGFLAAMSNSVRAAPEGARRPCSHSCSVRTETPRSWANRSCDSPVPSRMAATDGTVETRPCSPRLS